MDYQKVLEKGTIELIEWLNNEFSVDMPDEIMTPDDMDEAAKLLMQLSGYYSYLCSLFSYAKIYTRALKRGDDKEKYEDMVDRRDAIEKMLDAVKQQYAGVSRAVAIRIENNQELRMNSGGYIRDPNV